MLVYQRVLPETDGENPCQISKINPDGLNLDKSCQGLKRCFFFVFVKGLLSCFSMFFWLLLGFWLLLFGFFGICCVCSFLLLLAPKNRRIR